MARLYKVKDPVAFIRDAAIDLIAKQGIEKFSARNLAKKVKYSHGTIFQHFNNLDDLVIQVNAETLGNLHYVLNRVDIEYETSLDKLVVAAQEYIDFINSNANLWDCIMSFDRKGNAEITEWYQARLDKLMAIVSKLVKPNLRKGQDLEMMTNLLWAGLQGIYQISKRENFKSSSKIKPKKLAEELVNQLFG
jgi:AcrR family transcriptional regulator